MKHVYAGVKVMQKCKRRYKRECEVIEVDVRTEAESVGLEVHEWRPEAVREQLHNSMNSNV